jgi:cytochrome oxidase Cu insertion factor (SCO1/SenC/PrrC family)
MLISSALLILISPASAAPSLPGVLQRGLPMPGQASFSKAGIAQGQLAIDFTLKDTKGQSFTLSRLLSDKPVVLIIGSFT